MLEFKWLVNHSRFAVLRRSLTRDFFHSSDDAILQHYLDAMWMSRRFRQNSLNDSFSQLAGALILFLDHSHFHAGPDVGSRAAVHHFDMLITS